VIALTIDLAKSIPYSFIENSKDFYEKHEKVLD
jgi:hypothetical protein